MKTKEFKLDNFQILKNENHQVCIAFPKINDSKYINSINNIVSKLTKEALEIHYILEQNITDKIIRIPELTESSIQFLSKTTLITIHECSIRGMIEYKIKKPAL